MNFNFDLQRFANSPSATNLMLGAGKPYFRRWLNGAPTVLRNLGNVPKFNITPTIEKIQKFSSMDEGKELYGEAVKSRMYKLTLELNEITPYNLALGLYGEEGVEKQEAKTISNEVYIVTPEAPISIPYKNIQDVVIAPVTALPASIGTAASYAVVGTPGTAKVTASGSFSGAVSGSYFVTITKANAVQGVITDGEFTWQKGLGGTLSVSTPITGLAQTLGEGVKIAFTPGVSGQDLVVGEIYEIKATAAGASYVAGTDYILDKSQLRAGIIPIPETSSIPEGAKVKVSYTVPEGLYPKIMGGMIKKIEGDLLFIGDPAMGRSYVGEFWHVLVSPSGDIGLIGDDWGAFTVEMTILADRINHPDEPFFKITNA